MWIGPEASRLLTQSRPLRVHSVFERSVNLQSDSHRLLHLSATALHSPLRAPFGVEMTSTNYAIVHRAACCSLGDDWRWDTAGRRLILGLQGSVTLPHAFSLMTPKTDAGAASITPSTQEAMSSIHDDVDQLFSHSGLSEICTWLQFQQHTLEAHSGLLTADLEAVRWFLGRGPGLTPSGDDALVGMLASLHLQGLPGQTRESLEKLRHALLTVDQQITTAVAREYLLAACIGEFAGPLTRLMQAPADAPARYREARDELLSFGHHSGADVLLGFTGALTTTLQPLPS